MPDLRKFLLQAYWKAEALIVPGLRSSQYCYYDKLRPIVQDKIWVDLGCGHHVFGEWMLNEQTQVLAACRSAFGVDLDWPGLKAHAGISNKIFADLAHLPIESNSVEVVSANMVAEHLPEPGAILREIHRVLKPGGTFVFHTPNYFGWTTQVASRMPESMKKTLIRFLERRQEADVFPAHYRINTGSAIHELATQTDFAVEDITLVSSSAATVMLGPAVWAELLYIRSLQTDKRAKYRSNIVAVLRKDPDSQP
jgi:SAM-dependent methyltransferase